MPPHLAVREEFADLDIQFITVQSIIAHIKKALKAEIRDQIFFSIYLYHGTKG